MLMTKNTNIKRIYMDYAATTPVDPRVKKAMEPFWISNFGNPGGLYEEGRRAKEALEESRKKIAAIIGARPDEIIFTSGGTESINLAILGALKMLGGGHLITSKFEHHAVLKPIEDLQKRGFDVTYIQVNGDGVINAEDVKKALRPDTVFVSIMYANNEIGTIQPIAEIGKVIRDYKLQTKNCKLVFHTDACQASGYLDLNVDRLGVDLMSINASKIYGPKGVGFLYKKQNIKLMPQILGGGQEGRLRSGTENVAFAVAMAEALRIAQEEKTKEAKRLTKLRDYFISRATMEIPKVVLNGHATKRLPNNINISVLDIEGESLVLALDSEGIAFSTGSACTSESLDPSHVILALGKPYEFAHGSMRFTLGKKTTKKEIDYVIQKMKEKVKWLRIVSPINLDPDAQSMSRPEVFAGEGLRVKAKSKNFK